MMMMMGGRELRLYPALMLWDEMLRVMESLLLLLVVVVVVMEVVLRRLAVLECLVVAELLLMIIAVASIEPARSCIWIRGPSRRVPSRALERKCFTRALIHRATRGLLTLLFVDGSERHCVRTVWSQRSSSSDSSSSRVISSGNIKRKCSGSIDITLLWNVAEVCIE